MLQPLIFSRIACYESERSSHLSTEAIIDAVVNFAWQQISQRFGVPEHLVGKTEKVFLVIGYGKLGGIELGYKSDLDLVFLYQSVEGQTIGGKNPLIAINSI